MDNKKGYSRKTQKLMYGLLACIGLHLQGKDIAKKRKKLEKEDNKYKRLALEGLLDTEEEIIQEFKCSEYWMFKAKEFIKPLYLKSIGYKYHKKPLEGFREELEELGNETIENGANVAEFKDISVNYTMELLTKEIQNLLIMLNDSFSLALNMMNQKAANNFVTWLWDYIWDKEISINQYLVDKFHEDQEQHYIWTMLMKRKCAICGENHADLDHWDNVSSIGGYEYCDGLKTRFLPLCRIHHTEKGNIGEHSFSDKYKIKGIWLQRKDVKYLVDNKVYPNQFKAFKEG